VADTDTFARFLSSYEWSQDRKEFGGYSGIIMSPDGIRFTILSDRAHVIEGTLFRQGDRILGVRSKPIERLRLPDALFTDNPKRDTEGMAQDNTGRIYVSMESANRVITREPDGAWATLPPYPAISSLLPNKGLEGIAVAPDGKVFAIPEASNGMTAPFSVFRYSADTGWDVPHHITRTPGFLPVGADFDPMGRLYVLERGFAGFGFFSQVRRFSLGSDDVLDGEVLLQTKSRRHDNLEGLAVWTAPDGELRMTMVSDDNFIRFQKTEFVEYAVSK
jgi:hypothetical protein